jgi:hypothetical protein
MNIGKNTAETVSQQESQPSWSANNFSMLGARLQELYTILTIMKVRALVSQRA